MHSRPIVRQVVALVLVAGTSCASPAPDTAAPLPAAESPARADAPTSLGDSRNKQDLSALVGKHPRSCLPSSRTRELCVWSAGNRDAGWSYLATHIETEDRVNLICELPDDGSSRERGSCTVRPRRSNRKLWAPTLESRRHLAPGALMEFRRRMQERAWELLRSARSLVELSELVGDIPFSCERLDSQRQSCLWRTSSHSYGHGTLAATIQAPFSKKLRMRCELPTDGGPRLPDTCRVEVGS